MAVPLSIVASLGLALLLNRPIRGRAVYRTLFFLPSVVPAVAAAAEPEKKIIKQSDWTQIAVISDVDFLVGGPRGPHFPPPPGRPEAPGEPSAPLEGAVGYRTKPSR